jgi:pyruvate dehydrogenase E2 component (dihydrolipoamide acetyltransferase)
MTDYRMPSLGADMEAGTLVEWLVKPGDTVKRGDVVAVVETQKGAIEIEIFLDGVIAELVAQTGAKVPVGEVLARLSEVGAAPALAPRAATHASTPVRSSASARPSAAPPAGAPPEGAPPPGTVAAPDRPRATPAARSRAAALGIALATLRGRGVDGAICLADLATAAPPSVAPPRRAGFDAAAMRQAIAAAMTRSKREIPHYYLAQTVDAAPMLALLAARNAGRPPGERLLPAALLLRAAARALAETPQLNGAWLDGAFRAADGVHVGWAVSLRGGGLVAPAIRDADRLDLDGAMAALRDVVARARGGGLRASELSDATVTVTSLGERGAESVQAIITPPQVAAIGVGRIVERPWVVDGKVVPRPVLTLTLAGDHRATDGHLGGLLLSRMDAFLTRTEES